MAIPEGPDERRGTALEGRFESTAVQCTILALFIRHQALRPLEVGSRALEIPARTALTRGDDANESLCLLCPRGASCQKRLFCCTAVYRRLCLKRILMSAGKGEKSLRAGGEHPMILPRSLNCRVAFALSLLLTRTGPPCLWVELLRHRGFAHCLGCSCHSCPPSPPACVCLTKWIVSLTWSLISAFDPEPSNE